MHFGESFNCVLSVIYKFVSSYFDEGVLFGGVFMWQYRCPICGKLIEENVSKEKVKAIMRYSHRCPDCGGVLYVNDKGACLDLGEMLCRALEINTGIILSKSEALSHYVEA